MSEMHRTLELMRPEDVNGERAPQPTLANIGTLIEQARAAGVSVELSAYRIVQEALTNVVKHAGRAHAAVSVRYGEGELALEIVDDGHGTPRADTPRSEHGLVGMRERVALFGGALSAGPHDGRGYRVRALLPYGGDR